MYDIYDLPKSIPLGRQGEQYARAVEIDCAKMLSDYPGARLTLMQRRTRGETARIVKADVSDAGVITWSPDMDAMAVAGLGAIEIVAMVGDKVAKSVIAATAIAPSLTPPDTDTQSGWVKDVLDASDAAQGAMIAAQESAAAAAGSAAAAQSSANAAAGSASAAGKSASDAAGSADAASKSAGDAAQSASDADASAKAAAGSAADAAGALDSVKASADAAAGSARAAAESAKDASASKSGAAESAMEAAGSASAASKSASDAAKSASEASGSAAAAEESKTGAESAANAAKSEADKAAGSAAAADTSAQAAAGSAAAAAESAQGAADAAKVEAAKIIQDGEIARTSTWSSQKIADQLYQEVAASGNPAVIENALEGYPMSVKASWEPIQEGEGEPSPDNIRPIKGRNNVKITRKNETQEDSLTLTLPTTIYGGEVDAETGEGVKAMRCVQLTGTETWREYLTGKTKSYIATGGTNAPADPTLPAASSHFEWQVYAYTDSKNEGKFAFQSDGVTICFVVAQTYKTKDEWAAYLAAQYAAGTPVQVVYKLATPKTFAATGGGRIDALAGANTVSTDADSVEVKTRAAVAGIIDDTVITEKKAWSSKHTVDKLLPMQTVTGNPAVIETLEGYPMSIKASWEPIQEGEGEPSPDNIRPIKGRQSVKITVNGTEHTLALPDTIYGGEVDAVTGKGIKAMGYIRFTGTETWYERLTGTTKSYAATAATNAPADPKLPAASSHFEWQLYAYAENGSEGKFAFESNGITIRFCVTQTYKNKDDWAAYLAAQYAAGTPIQIAYKLATPESFTATGGGRIDALAGTNAISTDADTLTATAPTPPQTTASAAEAQAAKLDYVAMMADVDVDDLTAVDDAGGDSGMDADMPTDIEGSETYGKQEV